MKQLSIIVGIAGGLWLALVLVYQAVAIGDVVSARQKTEAFFKAIQAQKYDEAEKLFAGAVDVSQKISLEESFKLLSYDNVRADFDDGCVCTGNAALTFEVDEKPLEVHAIVTFSSEGMPQQVCAVHPPGAERGFIAELRAWNRMFCGGGSF
ncbi:hypothetical protein ACFQ88_25125 [Paenibacillus sp. NPDC056579]|uniref:hypothetical protein n=1 Tax=Paenibacillus sp. NPDC056579 TaxID=3345871 RepID=UPI003691AEDA